VFYFLAWVILPRGPFMARLALADGVEATWEVIENSNIINERYRVGTISLDYYGDSIVNSVSDTLAMIAGFVLAHRLPIWVVVGLAVLMDAQHHHVAALSRSNPYLAAGRLRTYRYND
jgi:Protein of unknown function (DUF2585)